MDCIGLLVMPARAAGLEIRDEVDYHWQVDSERLLRVVGEHCERLDSGEGLEAGEQLEPFRAADILLFYLRRPSNPTHAALHTGEGSVIHAWNTQPHVVEHGYPDVLWSRRFHSHWRYRWRP